MIRIDEIYQNTFLPLTRTRPAMGLHWFDPFGSVQFEDMVNLPPVSSNQAKRYLFWDQEPLHQHAVDLTLTQFNLAFKGKKYLITSEHESESVQRACRLYGFESLYYFFHGWAALDWYRGYDRSLLIQPPDQRHIIRTFVAPNRIVTGARQHRLLILYHIFKKNLTANWISCPAVCPVGNIAVTNAVKDLADIYPDIESVFDQQLLPMDFPGESGHPMRSCWLDLFTESADCLLYLVTETVASGRRLHLTEKTFKPICLQMPFVLVGTQGSLAYLRSYGFQTFGDLWDESYDLETDDVRRVERIADLLEQLDCMTVTQKQALFDQARPIIEHNYQHFYQGGFESVLWHELTAMLEAMSV